MQRDRRRLNYANVAATVALVLAVLAAGPVVAQPVVSATTSATSAVKRALGLSKAADRRSKRAIKLARRALRLPSPGVIAPAGPRGATGPTGPAGSDAEFNGAAAGGDLEGTYPNPLIAAGTLIPAHFGTIPAVSAYRTENQSIPHDGAGASVSLDHELFDTAEMHSIEEGQEKLFAPIDGIYQVTASINWERDSDGTRTIFLRKNGVGSTFGTDSRTPVPFPDTTAQSVGALIALDKDDYIDARVFQESGGEELDIKATGVTPVVSMVWVAPL